MDLRKQLEEAKVERDEAQKRTREESVAMKQKVDQQEKEIKEIKR